MAVQDALAMAVALPVLYAATFSLVKFLLTSYGGSLLGLAYSAGMSGWTSKQIVWGCVGLSWFFTWCSFYPVLFYTAWVCPAGHLDNSSPRKQKEELEGFGARVWAGHKNAHEALPGFLGGICCCMALEVPYVSIVPACILFCIVRALFHVLYALNIGALRSFSYAMGAVIIALLYVRALIPAAVPWLD
eukprot:TRINITY_DN31464_c0_g1_i1.p1 TRINITY_DN31464_c0_g1~~TRINITY_DN31464_c0_g1_i1.p1  ORF type:complete len:189 (+),score=26.04 TRINITY_DN31464_c0_g1_i1:57-623(+)